MNRVTLIGRLGGDPEVRSFPNGDRVANFSLATSESWKDKATGEKKERTEWHRIAIQRDGLVGVVQNWCRKGSLIAVEGQLRTRKWTDRDGVERYQTEVIVGMQGALVLLGSKDSGAGGERAAPAAAAPPAARPADDLDDDVPF